MPYATTDDEVRLYFEETGAGHAVILVHEFAGDLRSYEPQMRHFGKRYRTVAFNARGFPPSDVPEHVSSYSQARAADDILAVLDHIGEQQAHIVGLSMGGFATLHFGLRHPKRARSLCIGGCGYGAELDKRETFRAEADAITAMIRTEGMPAFALCLRADPRSVSKQGPARPRRIQENAGRTFCPRIGQHAAGCAEAAAVALYAGRGNAVHQRPHAHRHRR